ncbi:Rpn family recombination-promoting nuclease/putative transposase [Romeria aff. gracilis LEGE 07310]|uniref:Rpn family recombination-promoting nuclease/putative transposase n=1 Tax=Vasconcelosia minhoensis LEGE 07310 TaxID=915328 RepID=A0A8J7AM47_9CYAN|nr:Rpn family recombination-promoting nuclease/putative transposase [Romeria gracilis]MBE9080533.1 Rpn family recombination-promoting nuclease/putative transposase [Romeria aff. gracilis LEGE 07310]
MRRDSIFYQLFQQSPELLFELLNNPPSNAQSYQFDSVAVKEPRFEIDGVFLPPETPGVVYFCEVQFQKDEQLYERLFGESFLYFYRNRDRFSDWQAVVLYPSRSTEQSNLIPYQDLLGSRRVHRVYLDELGELSELPLGVALMVLTTVQENRAAAAAQTLLARSRQEAQPEASRAIIEMITTIMVYKFTNLRRQEVEVMLGVTLQETRFYQEAKEDGRVEEARSLVLRQLGRKVGKLPGELQSQVDALSLTQLEALSEALLNFSSRSDLETWLSVQE